MSDDEDEWLRTVARQNYELNKARKIQPGRGHRYRYKSDSDWWILIILLAGVLG